MNFAMTTTNVTPNKDKGSMFYQRQAADSRKQLLFQNEDEVKMIPPRQYSETEPV